MRKHPLEDDVRWIAAQRMFARDKKLTDEVAAWVYEIVPHYILSYDMWLYVIAWHERKHDTQG